MSELRGKVALVTGAGRNIGRAIALELAAAGAAIVVNARANRAEADSVVGAIEAAGGTAMPLLADVADAGAVATMVEAVVARFGALHILVNNAALRRETRFEEMSFEEWRAVTGSVLDGAFHCTKAALPHLKRAGCASIVNLGGLSAHTGAKDRAHVVTSKAGLVGFTRALAHDLASEGITVNCVAPGMIDTKRAAGPEPQHHKVHVPLVGRRGRAEEIAAAVRYLCGPGARYVTGQTIHVNGGLFLG